MSWPVRDGAVLQRVRWSDRARIGSGGVGASTSGGATTDPLRARLGLERALAAVSWSPTSLGPSSLLFVRRLSLDLRRPTHPVGDPARAFAQQVSQAVSAQAAQAQRPWRHPEAASAPAVCFEDESELAACLWRDLLLRAVETGWWWPGVLRSRTPRQWLSEQVFSQGMRLVPALTRLASQGWARSAVAQMDESERLTALRALQASHAMPGMTTSAHPGAMSSTRTIDELGERAALGAAPSGSRSAEAARPLELRRLLEVVPELQHFHGAPSAGRLLASALSVQRSPSWARSAGFQRALAALDEASSPVGNDRPSEAAETDVSALRSNRQHVDPHGAVHEPRWEATIEPFSAGPSTSDERVAPPTLRTSPTSADLPPAAMPDGVDESPASSRDAIAPTAHGTHAHGPRRSPAEPVPGEGPTVLDTRYGGLFYLLNVALALRLYGDFTMPRAPGLAWSPWNLLAWTGQAWFGQDLIADPLWRGLADLAGRPVSEPPIRSFETVPDWRLGPGDLAAWPAQSALRVHATPTRLRIGHAEGFAIADVRRIDGMPPMSQARAVCDDLTPCRESALRRGAVASARGTAAARWLSHWRAYVDARLRAALGLARDIDPAALVARHRAQVQVSLSTVDVWLSLADLPLSVRIAGLDRDPGWMPALGRSVMFHFE